MALSPELQRLHDQELTYKGKPELVGAQIKDLIFHGLVGATTSGKTTLIDRVVDLMPDSNAVPSAMDRARKEGDPDDYETTSDGMTTEKLTADKEAGKLVNYAVFPTSTIYATYPEYYRATHNFLPTMSSSIPQLRQAGFKGFDLTYVYMPAEQWEELIKAKNFNGKRKERMIEAVESFEYALNNPESLLFLQNNYGQKGLREATRELMFIANGTSKGEDPEKALAEIKRLYKIAYDLAA